MNIEHVLKEYDGLFGNMPLSEIESFLYEKITEAVGEQDNAAIITLLNEMIGLCRDTSQKEKALAYCAQVKKLLHQMELQGTKEYATSMQNIANAYRAFGLWNEAQDAFVEIEKTYEACLEKGDYFWASLYNNWSLLFQEMEEYEQSVKKSKLALEIIQEILGAEIKVAVTKSNLANSLFQLGEAAELEEGYAYLKEAIETFVQDGERDFHYGAALVAMGDYYFITKDNAAAKKYYRKGIVEILIHTGKTEFYDRVVEKYHEACDKEESHRCKKWTRNLDRSRRFYETHGKAMIHDLFGEYEDRIAVGMVGEGSDCFGFDDEISTDHDYAVGFCMWLTKKDMPDIGESLQEAYENLILSQAFNNGEEQKNDNRSQIRRGVFEIDAFFQAEAEEYRMAELVNGEIFRDNLGEVTAIRERLKSYYPENIWRKRLANGLHDFSQYGQSNYARMMAREDDLTAQICIGKTIEAAMDIAYILLKKYAPYYKWKRKGLENEKAAQDVLWICEELALAGNTRAAWTSYRYDAATWNTDDKRVVLIETLAAAILDMMKQMKLVKGTDLFLESYLSQILESRMDLVEKIVELEWQQFDKVKNEGGRASCQDDYATFSIMRKSQYFTWDKELLKSYYQDLQQAGECGWNLIMEKYARMMKSTAPEKYEALKNELPVRSAERERIAEEIIRIQVSWMEDFAKEYPKMAVHARTIHTEDDTEFTTSYETYLRGELGTYGENTFILYGRFITDLVKDGKNLAYETMNYTAKLYGYESVEDAEAKMK